MTATWRRTRSTSPRSASSRRGRGGGTKTEKEEAGGAPARASGRLAGKPLADEASLFAALDGALADADAEKDEAYEQLRFEQAYRASKKPRLSAAQSAELHGLEAAAPGAAPAATSAVGYVGTPLTAAELAAAEQAADNLANGAVHGGLKGAERMARSRPVRGERRARCSALPACAGPRGSTTSRRSFLGRRRPP